MPVSLVFLSACARHRECRLHRGSNSPESVCRSGAPAADATRQTIRSSDVRSASVTPAVIRASWSRRCRPRKASAWRSRCQDPRSTARRPGRRPRCRQGAIARPVPALMTCCSTSSSVLGISLGCQSPSFKLRRRCKNCEEPLIFKVSVEPVEPDSVLDDFVADFGRRSNDERSCRLPLPNRNSW